VIPEEIRRFAEAPGAWGEIPPESGLTRILTGRYCLMLGPVPSFTSVSRLRLDPDEVPEVLAEVRELVAEHGHRHAIWWVGPSATPNDLVDRLRAHGLVPDERANSEPHATSMALLEKPTASGEGVEARRVESLEDFRAAATIAASAFEEPEADHAAYEAILEENYARERAGHAPRTYIAFVDGRPVGTGRAIFAADCPAVLMLGGGVVPEARGRGVYRALVGARWDDAVAAGTPALVTHSGAMSRPILERLGFQAVAEQEILLDPVTT
jgi:GNAT superfamily N-acetyltransferase